MAERRVRTLTEKAMALYTDKVLDFDKKLTNLWDSINQISDTSLSYAKASELQSTEHNFIVRLNNYETLYSSYCEFLVATKTFESNETLHGLKALNDTRLSKIQLFRDRLVQAQQVTQRMSLFSSEHSHRSIGSARSGNSVSSSIAARVKAEAAKARLKFVEKEAELRRQKAILDQQEKISAAESARKQMDLQTELLLLNEQKEAAQSQAEADVLDNHFDNNQSELHLPVEHVERRVDEFVRSSMAPNINIDQPQVPLGQNLDSNNAYVQLTKFLLRKDLALSRLIAFNDKAENYQPWKGSFKTVCREMGVNAAEEVDLLVKWLGVDTKKQALSMRAACSHNPEKGLSRIWERLDERYGNIESVYTSILTNLDNFPKISVQQPSKLYDLLDMLYEMKALKSNPKYSVALSYFDSSLGVSQILGKLPNNMQEKWVSKAVTYKTTNDVTYPPFTIFVEFVKNQAKIKNDASLQQHKHHSASYAGEQEQNTKIQRHHRVSNTKKTDVIQSGSHSSAHECPLHKTNSHHINTCRVFKNKTFIEKRQLLKEQNLCFKCFRSGHSSRDCSEEIVCSECGKPHNTAMHINIMKVQSGESAQNHGGERNTVKNPERSVTNKCTQICSPPDFCGKSCAKIVRVNAYAKGNTLEKIPTYAIIDDQSNRTLVSPDLLDLLHLDSELIEYSVNSCNGSQVTCGRLASGLMIESISEDITYELSSVLECHNIPNQREEIPTPEVAFNYEHLRDIMHDIPPVDPSINIQILIGRDLLAVHHVIEQKIGPKYMPYAQRLSLGWVIIGEACLGRIHQTNTVNVNKTCVLNNGRSSVLAPCTNSFDMTEEYRPIETYSEIYAKHKNDEKPGLSMEDRDFLTLMDDNFVKEPSGNWSAPLPFKTSRQRLPNNKVVAERRAKLLDTSLRKNPTKRKHFVAFMQKIFEDGHAEVAPRLSDDEECWYLPIFGVYHPKKLDQIRCVFDASAQFKGTSLNDVLMSGPDLTNSLLGVLLRFRKEPVAVTTDIQHMFYCFHVEAKHRNFLRFIWYKDNDTNNDLIEYRMKVHVFGNKPSPAVATYGLRKTAEISRTIYGSDVTKFVGQDFYVDDGLTSLATEDGAIELMKNTQEALKVNGNLRLHKIASNSVKVLSAFPSEDLAKNLISLDLCQEDMPMQHSLGLCWNIQSDAFTFCVPNDIKPFTRRGILSTVNSLYDPLGFAAPVTITGKLLLRDLVSTTQDWDEPLPQDKLEEWSQWQDSLKGLNLLEIPRQYVPMSLSGTEKRNKELHIYCDASEKAIAAVAYVLVKSANGKCHSSFVLGKAKVAPSRGHTIPRLELCAAVLGAEIGSTVLDHIDIEFDQVKYYSDSKVVLGYICNRTRRFFTYISNRVEKINTASNPEQWKYIPTHLNPADCATRGVSPNDLPLCPWLIGPRSTEQQPEPNSSFPLVEPDKDTEIRANVSVTKVVTGNQPSTQQTLESERFSRFSTWHGLIRAITCLQHVADSYRGQRCLSGGWHAGCEDTNTVTSQRDAETFILRSTQREAFPEEYECLETGQQVLRNSAISALYPYLDNNGVLRVGGRLRRSDLPNREKHPAIIPRKHHIAILLIRHFHDQVKHQGRHLTEGALRANGYWIVGAKRLVSSVIHVCVKCRKLRGKHVQQLMSDLPAERLEPAPPFTFVGVDTFGPWYIVTRKTRGGQANSKRWAILFTCLTIRAIHIEVVAEMSSSAFINALRRFTALYGNVKLFRSDRGTNFTGATSELNIDTINVEDSVVKDFLKTKRTTWVFNPPHASHMGGVWERMIGVARRILDSILSGVSSRNLTHDVLTTVMAEVCAIVNARPIVPVSTDSSYPEILSPSILLTQKRDVSTATFGQLSIKDIYKAEWRHVQVIAEQFWKRWRVEYLQLLQSRRKWQIDQPNLQKGDIVLVKDSDVVRNQWPYGIVENVFPSADGKIRTLSIRLQRDGKFIVLTRPVSEIVLLLSKE